ncbi:MAG: D-xylose ABC transporter ATP-binding protein [Spirochaetes bacterium]|nr:MAG: D-xylose ABC transporter ATP-binding protein [Spirochaetota bacterium]
MDSNISSILSSKSSFICELREIKKYFHGVKALDGVDFRIRPGEIHALIGENGAGKSTLVKILTGIYQPDSGDILLDGKKVSFPSAHESQLQGIAAIHQETSMFPELSVVENIFMGHPIKKSNNISLDWRAMRKKTKELLDRLGIILDPESSIKNLSVAERHLVEIVKALSLNARIVIMDEPTSALTMNEVEHLFNIIRQLKKEGKAIIFISHKLDEVFEIADSYTVLRDGHFIGSGRLEEVSMDELINMMVGRSVNQMFPKIEVELGDVVMEVRNLSKFGVFNGISFKLLKGEILGFFGLVGSGRSEVIRTIFGIDDFDSGEILLDGKSVKISDPKVAMKMGIALVPEDRQLQGLILKMKIRENITLPIIDRIAKSFFLNYPKEVEIAEEYGKQLDIKAASWEDAVQSLSGGNQQKVVLSKWLATNPRILILDEPTKGIDVGTKAAVHRFMGELAEKGISIIMISSELPEVMGMSDNIIVMHEGVITARFKRDEATSEDIIKAATGLVKVE